MVVVVLGGVVGWIMAAMGLGKQKPTTQGRQGHKVAGEPAGAES